MIKGEFDFTKKLIRENLNEQLNAFQDILTPTLLFDDSIAAKEIIDSFSYNPQIEGAVLWREDESSNTPPLFQNSLLLKDMNLNQFFRILKSGTKKPLQLPRKLDLVIDL